GDCGGRDCHAAGGGWGGLVRAAEPALLCGRRGGTAATVSVGGTDVLVPWEVFAALRPAPSLPVAPEALTPAEEQQAREIAVPLRARGVAARGDPLAPSEAVKADPTWQKRWDDVLAKFRSVYPPGTPPEVIEADIAAAAEEVRFA